MTPPPRPQVENPSPPTLALCSSALHCMALCGWVWLWGSLQSPITCVCVQTFLQHPLGKVYAKLPCAQPNSSLARSQREELARAFVRTQCTPQLVRTRRPPRAGLRSVQLGRHDGAGDPEQQTNAFHGTKGEGVPCQNRFNWCKKLDAKRRKMGDLLRACHAPAMRLRPQRFPNVSGVHHMPHHRAQAKGQ